MQEYSITKRVFSVLIAVFLIFVLSHQFVHQTEYTHSSINPDWPAHIYNNPDKVNAIRSDFDKGRVAGLIRQ